MSPSKKSDGPRSSRRTHATDRHGSAPGRASHRAKAPARPHMAMILALDAVGWRVTKIQPPIDRDLGLWCVTIDRVDFVASMTVTAPDPDMALEELARYTAADADEP